MFTFLLYLFAGIAVCLFSLAVIARLLRSIATDLDEYDKAQRELVAYAAMLAALNNKGGKH